MKRFTALLGALIVLATTADAQTMQRTIPQPLPGHPGNVFLRGEEVQVPRPDAADATGWTCLDYEQRVVTTGTDATAKLGRLPVGYYEVWATGADGKRLAKTTIGVLEPLKAPTPLDSPIGIDMATAWFYNPRGGTPAKVREAANQAALAGLNRVRDRLNWGQTEPERGQFAAQTFYDETARVQSEANLQVLQVFHSSPKWANPNGRRFPLDLRDGYNYVKAMSARWRGQVGAWEPWNEADIPGFGGHTGVEIATYQKATYWGLRAGNPDAIVGQNVFAQPTRTAVLDNFLENEPAAYFDTFNFHHYYPIESYPKLYAAMRAASGGKPMWVSEAGTHIPWEGDEKAQEPTWENQQRQARFVTQCFAASLHEGSSATFFFLLPHYVEGKVQFGLTHRDLTPRPGYLALAAAGRLLAGAKPLGRSPANASLRAFAFRAMPDGNAQTVVVAWAQSGKTALTLPDKPSAAYDFLGRPLAANAIEVGPDPIYLLFAPGEELKLALNAPPSLPPRVEAKPCSVVLQALLPEERIRLGDSAYRLTRRQALEFPVFVYNFGNQTVTTALKATIGAGLQISPLAAPVTVKPMERVEVRFRVNEAQGPLGIDPIVARFTADCGAQGQALAAVRFMLPLEDIEPVKSLPVKSAADPAHWQKNQSPGQMTLEASEGGVSIDSLFQPGDRWAYPLLKPLAAELPVGDWDGLALTIVPLLGQAEFRLQFDEANGSSYLAEANLPKPLEMNKPYRAVVLFKLSNWGSWSKADDNGQLDPAQIRAVKIGLNTKEEHVRYLVRDVAWVKYAR